MAEEIKELLEKIHEEGIKAAQNKASEIEKDARAKAEMIIQKAQLQANNLIADGQEKVKRFEDSAKVSLKQASRDMILSLKKEIISTLEKVIKADTSKILTSDELARIITNLIKEHSSDNVVVSLSQQDKDKLSDNFINKLKEELKKGIQLKSSSEIQTGFIISFDGGKSSFDFTDKSISEYLSLFLNSKIAELIKG